MIIARINVMLMDVITSPRGSARCGKEWSCRAESIFALKGINLKIVHSEAVHCYMGYFETYILPIIFFMYGGILSLTFSHLYHYWHFPTMVGFCHGGNVLGDHHHGLATMRSQWLVVIIIIIIVPSPLINFHHKFSIKALHAAWLFRKT